MAEEINDSISIPEKILQTLFSGLLGQEGFDQNIISRLQELSEQGKLTKVDEVTAVLKTDAGGINETS